MSLSLPLPSRSSQIRTLAITPASRKHKFLHIPVQQWTPSRPLQHLHTNHQYYLSRTSFQCMSRSQQQEYEVERLFSNLNQVTLKREPGIPVLSFFFIYKKYFNPFSLLHTILSSCRSSVFSGSLSSAILLVAGTTVYICVFLLVVRVYTQFYTFSMAKYLHYLDRCWDPGNSCCDSRIWIFGLFGCLHSLLDLYGNNLYQD